MSQTLPAEPGGRADRGSKSSFLYKPAQKLVAVGDARCRTWWIDPSGACQSCFLQYYIAVGASTNCQQWVQSQPSYLPPQGAGMGGKDQPGKQSLWVGNGQQEGEQSTVQWEGYLKEACPKHVGKGKEARCRDGFWGRGKSGNKGVLSVCLLHACLYVFQTEAGTWNTAAAMPSRGKCQLC